MKSMIWNRCSLSKQKPNTGSSTLIFTALRRFLRLETRVEMARRRIRKAKLFARSIAPEVFKEDDE